MLADEAGRMEWGFAIGFVVGLLQCGVILASHHRQISPKYWVSSVPGSHELLYRKTSNGDQIMDFSAVGYKGSNAPLPTPPIVATVKPTGKYELDTKLLQSTIDAVAKMDLQHNGFRGTIKLLPGTFNLGSSTIFITASGIVIDGSGTNPKKNGTLLDAHDLKANILFKINGNRDAKGIGKTAKITETVPSGTSTIKVDRVGIFKVGDHVMVNWPWSKSWIEMMNMSKYWHEKIYRAERVIKGVNKNSNTLLLDVPLPFRIDLVYLDHKNPANIQRIEYPVQGRINNVGLQNFMAVKNIVEPNDSGCFLKMARIEDAWINNLVISEFGGTLGPHPRELWHATMFVGGSRITIANLKMARSRKAPKPGDKPFDIALEGEIAQQILVRDTVLYGENEYSLMTNAGVAGPNVFYNSSGFGKNIAQPHMLFATGILYDNIRIRGGGIEFINRGAAGSGHGIAAGYSVAWNTVSDELRVLSPPNAENWALGCTANYVNQNTNFDVGRPGIIAPRDPKIPSLYIAQVRAAALNK